jgi:putative DNA primase/helicase
MTSTPSLRAGLTATDVREALACSRAGCSCSRPGDLTHCPAHDDRTPSLSVRDGERAPLLTCHAGCASADVIASLRARGAWPDGERREETTRYPIRDLDGRTVAVHVRRDLSDGSKRISWERDGLAGLSGLRAASLPLYGIEYLRDAGPTDAVIVTEGEKAADALRARGFLALGTVTGAEGVPGDDTLRPLVGRSVILWPDADEPGQKHMRRIAERLATLGHGDVRMINWPDAPRGGDAADFRGSDDDLAALIQSCAPCVPSAPHSESGTHGAHEPRIVRLADVTPEPVDWLAEPYIAIGKVTLLEGDPGVGKSHVSLAIATAVAAGRGFPGMAQREPAPVLLLSAEDGLGDTIRPRLDGMSADVSRVFALDGPVTLDDAGFDFLDAQIGRLSPLLVIVDPIVAYLGGRVDLHRANEVREVTSRLAKLAERHGCAIVAVRHLTKSTAGRGIYRGIGSIDLTAAARSVLLVGADPETGERGVVQIKNNLAPFGSALGFALDADGFRWTEGCGLTAERLLAPDRDPESRAEQQSIETWLRDVLLDGEMAADEVKTEAASAGYAWRTVQRHREAAGVEYRRDGFGKDARYIWSLRPSALVQAQAARHARHARHDQERGTHGAHAETDDA